ncbi:hypothetical protein V5098_06930 [Vibrio coralliirubri]|uniref:lipopolysaccharide biosynthesis protein n=1 Tax=Vibrio coralliirubri TaxID=1516159 RepID=UPI002FD681AA
MSAMSLYIRFGIDTRVKNLTKTLSIFGFIILSSLVLYISGDIYYSSLSAIIFYYVYLSKLRYREKTISYNFLLNAQKLTFLMIILLVAIFDVLSSKYALYSLGASYAICSLGCLILNRKIEGCSPRKKEERVEISVMLKYSANACFLSFFIWGISVSDQFFIANMFGEKVLAPYAVAFKISSLLTILSGVLMTYYTPIYFREMKAGHLSEGDKVRKLSIFSLVLFTFLIIVFDKEVYGVMGAAKYYSSSYLMKIMIISEFCRIVASLFLIYNSYTLNLKYNFCLYFFVALFVVILNQSLIPIYGEIGAISIKIVSSMLILIFSIKVYCRERKMILEY